MRSGTTRVAQNFYSATRRFDNAGERSAAILPPVEPHRCREEVRVCANRRGEVYKITWRH
jgi:hypothetical protein